MVLNKLVIGVFLALITSLIPTYADEGTPYRDAFDASKEHYNTRLGSIDLMKDHFSDESILVVLSQETFVIFLENGLIEDVWPGGYDKATLVIKTDEETLAKIARKEMTFADAVTLKQIVLDVSDHASFKTKLAVRIGQLTSSVVYFFDSLFA